jgi:hypothetical protein
MRWAIAIESAAGVIHAQDDIEAVAAALRSDGLAFAVGVAGDMAARVVRATYQVDAESVDTAAAIGVRAFHRALHAAGARPSTGRLELTPALAPVEDDARG